MTKKHEEKNTHLVRPPVVAVMGHVDHGKTSILDAIRGTRVQACEVGGITQNIRAHIVEHKGHKITFIDTPGHEAFFGMRSRGAKVTDMVMLVVGVDDGVRPQTKESIKFAQEAKVPIIVAVNKVDLPGVNVSKVVSELAQNNVLVEEYGGDVQLFKVSATQKLGLEELLDGIILQAEMLELSENPVEFGKGKAVVLESKLDCKLGPVALILATAGRISVGDFIISKAGISNIRVLLDECSKTTGPVSESTPVLLVGLERVSDVGDILYFSDDEKTAKTIYKEVESRNFVEHNEGVAQAESPEVDDLSLLASLFENQSKNESVKKLNVVVKTDTQGTLEVVENELKKLSNDEVEVNILCSGTGDITRKDVLAAKDSKGIVIGFQVQIPSDLQPIIQHEKVLVRVYKVIYDLIDEVSDALEGLLEPEETEEEVARAKVKKVFTLSDGAVVAGSAVVSGNVIKGYRAWVERDGEEIGRGKIISLKQQKSEVKEVSKGQECGILFDQKIDINENDEIVLYKVVKN